MCNSQKLILGNKLIENNTNISDLNLSEGSEFELIAALQGGATSTMDPAIVELSKKYKKYHKFTVL